MAASRKDFPNALSGSVLAARKNSAILLIENKDVSKQKELLKKLNIGKVIVLGAQGSVDDDTLNLLTEK